jgi:hypothetical protein
MRPMELYTIGIDLGKTVFHLVGLNRRVEVVVRKKLSRPQLLRFTANLHVQLIGMEACGGAHFLGRALREQGHEARLIPAQYVKPYVKTNKSDYIDAEAVAEAVGRPTMRFVPIKTDHQLDLQSLHWVPYATTDGQIREKDVKISPAGTLTFADLRTAGVGVYTFDTFRGMLTYVATLPQSHPTAHVDLQ